MAKKIPPSTILPLVADTAAGIIETQRHEALLKTGALQNAIFNSVNFSKIATDKNGVIQLFNVGAERMLGYAAAEVVNKITPADISDPQELIARAKVLSIELGTPITPGFEALVFKASREIEDIYELTYIRKDGSRFPAVVSVTALRDAQNAIIGFLLIGTDNTARKQAEAVLQKAGAELERLRAEAALRVSEQHYRTLFESIGEGFCIIEKIGGEAGETLDFRYIEANPAVAAQSGITGVVGKTLRQVIPDEFEEWLVTFDAILQTGEPISFERRLASQGRVMEVHAFRVDDDTHRRVAVNFKDITKHKRTEEQLRQNRDTFFNLVENAPFGLYVVDAQFRLSQVSNAAQKVFSHVRPLIGRDFEEILRSVWADPFASEAIGRFRHTLKTGEPYAAPNTIQLRNDIPDVESYDWKIERITLPNGEFGVVCYFYDNTERQQVEDALRESEAFSRSIIKSSPDCIKVLDLEGNLLSMLSGQELLGIKDIRPFLNTAWIEFWEGEHRQSAQAAITLALAGGTGNFVGFFRTFRGEPKWWDVTVTPILDIHAKPKQLLAVSRDVTQRRQAQMNFEFLASVSQDLVSWASVDEMMRTVGAKMGAYFQLSLCAFAEIDETAEQVVIPHDWHREDVPSLIGVHRLADFLKGELIQAARAGEVMVVCDVATDSRTDPANFAPLKVASFLTVPLIHDGHWRFALALHKDTPYNWRADEIELARELTARIWTRLERLRAEAQLRVSEERLQQALDSAQLGTWNIDPVTELFTSDERFRTIFGISLNGLNEAQALDNVHPGDKSRVEEVVRAAARVDGPAPYEVEYRVVHSDGSLHWVLAKGRTNFSGSGAERRLQSYAGTVADITERKQHEEVVRQRTAQFETLLNEAPLGVYLVDGDLRLRQVNPTALAVFGANDMIGNDLGEIMHNLWPKAQADEIIQRFRHTLATGEPWIVPELIEERADRQVTEYYEWQISRIPLPEGGFGVVCYFRDISQRVLAQQQIRDSEGRFRAAIDIVSSIIWTNNAHGLMEGEQPGWGNFTGQTQDEYQAYGWAKAVHPDDAQPTIDAWTQAVAEKRLFEFEHRIRRRDGEWRLCSIRAVPLVGDDGIIREWVGVHTDITERKASEKAIRESQERYRNLFNSIDEGFCIIEMIFDEQQKAVDWRFLEVNPSFEKQSGVPDVTGKRMRELVPDHEENWFEIYGKVALTGEPVRFVNQAKAMEGRWFDLYAFQIGGEQSRRVAVIFTDITERKQFESTLNNAMAIAEKANRAKSDFLSSMSHELRTPLNAILGFAQLMQSGSPPPTALQKRSIEQILKGGWYLLELINEILDLALIESGKVAVLREPIALAEVLIECRAMIEPQAHARGIELTFPTFDTSPFVQANQTRLKQVLLNFLSNAVKYNKPSGAVVVACSMSPPDSLRISVSDTGEGLDAQQLAQLFQPFNRLGKERSVEEGTGIGLVVTKRLVDLMGGVIGAESTVGVGSVFWLELPLASAPQIAAVNDHTLLKQPLLREWASPRTVLYVEDNPANLELVEQLFARRPDLHLLSAVDGSLGVEFARDHLPDVILMDISLPGIDGIEMLKTLREDPLTAHIPVIAISAYAMSHDIERGLEAGFLLYLTKPIVVNEFMEALDRALAFAASFALDVPGAFPSAPGQVGGKSDTGHAETL